MTQAVAETHTFRVHARHVDGHHARTLEEASFEAAAVAYVEDLHELPSDGDEVSIMVQEVETGRQHCFRIDLQTGDTAPCD